MKYQTNSANIKFINSEFTHDFPEPVSIADAEDRLLVLRQELSKIRQQLNDTDRKDKMNIADDQYAKWRYRAIHARDMKSIQQKKLARWIADRRAERALSAIETREPMFILAELVEMISDLRQRYRVPLSAEQQNMVSLAENVVNNFEVR